MLFIQLISKTEVSPQNYTAISRLEFTKFFGKAGAGEESGQRRIQTAIDTEILGEV